ncbi:MAG TPA: hypothetical protein VKC61_13985 [Pyrinomonadaceae bacterium]|nr:hypothetical protein [Pyrinomonadaceae bacterium]
MTSDYNNCSRVALVVAHPSHELRVHGWMQRAKPHVFVLTDGSGRAAQSSLSSTTKVLSDLGIPAGSIYGRFTDLEVYEAFINGNFSLFLGLAQELAEQFVRQRIEYVVADSAEGYSPTHDACRLLTDAAVEIIQGRHNQKIASFDFAVVGSPDDCPKRDRERAIWIHLDDEGFLRKLKAVHSYDVKLALDVEAALAGNLFEGVSRLSAPQFAGAVDTELSTQVSSALNAFPLIEEKLKGAFEGIELNRFRTECLRPVSAAGNRQTSRRETPFYELYGEKMVLAGRYQKTIRYIEHFLPLEKAVWRFVQSRRVNELLPDEFLHSANVEVS